MYCIYGNGMYTVYTVQYLLYPGIAYRYLFTGRSGATGTVKEDQHGKNLNRKEQVPVPILLDPR